MARDRFTDWLWLGAAVGLFMLGQSALLGAAKKGLRVYKFPAQFPDEWDGRIVGLKIGRRYKLPLPQATEPSTFWTLQFREGDESRSFRQKLGIAPRPVGWETPDGMIFTWIEPTEDMLHATVQLQLWNEQGTLLEFYEVKLVTR